MKFRNGGLIMRGAAMGVAEVIPGVSGGTIAFITGIYKALLDSIKSVDAQAVKLLFSFQLKALWSKVNGPFLLSLMIGMLGGVVVGVFGVTYFLENYPEVLWALFFGLILGSVPMMLSQISKFNLKAILLFLVGVVIAYGVTSINPMEGSSNYLFIFIGGAIAVSALVLPGISGSFMLLIMGLYTTIIPTIKSFLKSPELSEFLMLAVFGLGMLTGLLLFSRVVSAAFDHYRNGTIALMSGFMLGSLNKIWPWRNVETILNKNTGQLTQIDTNNINSFDFASEHIKIVKELNVLPAQYFSDARLVLVVISFVVGLLLIYLVHRTGLLKNTYEQDIH